MRKVFWDVSVIVAGPPQLKRMTPPLANALASAVSVQFAAVPGPTVAVVGRVSALIGVGQIADGLAGAALAGIALAGLVVATDSSFVLTLSAWPRPRRERDSANSKPKFFTRIPLLSHSMSIISTCRRLQTAVVISAVAGDVDNPT
jgi:hypothetical protein